MPDFRVCIQGDRNAISRFGQSARSLAQAFRDRGVAVNLGAYGQIVGIFRDAGCDIRCYGFKPDRSEYDPLRTDCFSLAVRLNDSDFGICPAEPEQAKVVAWGLRLGLLLAHSDAFVYFTGRHGTIAQTVATLAHGIASQESGEPAKKVALIGWSKRHFFALVKLFFPAGKPPTWLKTFRLEETDAVIAFLTEQ